MGRVYKIMGIVALFLVLYALIIDVNNYSNLKDLTKDSIDLATKAAALQEDKVKASEGIFEIDNKEATKAFLDVMSKNMSTDVETIKKCLVEYKAINTPQNYTDPTTGATYKISNPTYVATIRYQYNGLLIKKDICISNNFGGAEILKTYNQP
jgi:Flp pilus assembly protein TadG